MFIKFKPTLLLFAVLIGAISSSTAATNQWKETNAQVVTKSYKKVLPEKFRSVQINYESLRMNLANASIQNFGIASRQSTIEIALPMPYGGYENFKVFETPMMEEGLAAKYPEIKTYTAVSLTNPGNIAKIDVGYMGFHAMVLSTEGRYFIDPVSNENNSDYIVYYRRDLPTWANVFNCSTVSDEQFELENKNRLEEYYAKSSSAVVTYRQYRLALACTVEYSKAATGLVSPTKAQVLAKMVTSMNRINGVYETEVAVHMNLVANNDTLIYNTGTSPYSNNDGAAMLSQNQTTVNARIGSANYDIGHVFSTGGGGIASLGSVCVTSRKGQGVTGSPSPVGDAFDIDYVAHEMGHQFAGNHTFNSVTGSCAGGNRNSTTAYEPGSGTTIMAYAGICGADDIALHSDPYFHAISIDEINAFITTTANACAAKTVTTNNTPTVDAGANYTIPINTPFQLKGSAVDPDGPEGLTYSWEQMDLGPQGAPNSATGNAPLFRFFPPKTTSVRLFPQLSNILANSQTKGEKMASYARNMKFRLVVRDNVPNAGATGKDEMTIAVSAAAGPFSISSSNTADTFYVGTTETVNWLVGNTDIAPINCSMVRILLSTDNGVTFPIILADSTANDGTENITVPNNLSTTARVKVEAIGNIFFDINNSAIKVLAPAGPGFNLFNAATSTNACPPDSVEFRVTAGAILGFNSPITLSTSNLPAGAVAGPFTKNPMMPGDTSYVKVSTAGLTAGAKTLKINGVNASVNANTTANFTVLASVSAAAVITSPTQQQLNVLPNASFTWNNVANATAYHIQIASDSSFNTLIVDSIINGSGSTLFNATALPQYTKLFYRVGGLNTCGDGPFSGINGFTTNGVPAAPTNLFKVTSTATSITIKWTDNAMNESGYKVEKSDTTNTNYKQVGSLSSDATQFISNGLTVGVTYFYRVKCTNLVGSSLYSNELSVNFGVGVNNETSATILSIYPNPTNNLLSADLDNEYKGNVKIQIVDELGRIVYTSNVNKSNNELHVEMNLSDLPKGVYFLKMQTDNDQLLRRIMKF